MICYECDKESDSVYGCGVEDTGIDVEHQVCDDCAETHWTTHHCGEVDHKHDACERHPDGD